MSNSASKKLALVKDFINEFKFEKALQLIKDIEQIKNLTSEEVLTSQVYKSRIYYFLGQNDVSLKIADNTILINPIEPFLACYVIKGQSYPAQQKLTRFSNAIKASSEIWNALNRAAKTSEMLELDNPPSLGSTVKEIFIS